MKYEQRCENCLELNQGNKKGIIECFNCGIKFYFKCAYKIGERCTCCWCDDNVILE